MQNLQRTGALTAVILFFSSLSVSANTCADNLNNASSVTSIIKCLKTQGAEIESLRSSVKIPPELLSGTIIVNLRNKSCPAGWRWMGTTTVDLQDTGEMLGYLKSRNLYDAVNISDEKAAGAGHDLVRAHLCFKE